MSGGVDHKIELLVVDPKSPTKKNHANSLGLLFLRRRARQKGISRAHKRIMSFWG